MTLDKQQTSPDVSITQLGLSTRAVNTLFDAGITTAGDALAALEKGDEALTGLKGFGSQSLAALKKRLREHGFTLPGQAAPSPQTVAASSERSVEAPADVPVEEERTPEATSVQAQEEAPSVREAPEVEAAAKASAPAEADVPVRTGEAASAPAKDEPVTFGQRLSATLAQPRNQLRFGSWAYGLIGVLIIVALLLPPISLPRRLGITGYDTLNGANSSLVHADGLTLSVNPETSDRLRVRLESVPRLKFLEGSAGDALRKAVKALPGHIMVKSPLYQIQMRGEPSQPVMIDVVMPNDADPWETLDLYTWTGKEWKWVGSELHAEVAEHEFLRAQVTDVPDSILVVQTELITPTISTVLEPGDNPVSTAAGVLDEVNPTGLLLGTDGSFVGDPNSLPQADPGAGYVVMPTLRNWAPGASVNRGLLSDVLTMPEIQETHIANVVQLCIEQGFAGVEVDYRGVTSDEKDVYTNFVSALANALHDEGLRLSVVVEQPTPTDGSWDGGGYDLAKLGAVADTIKVPFPEDPTAYVEGGRAHRLLDWVTAQVDRYKLRMQVSSLSVEQGGGEIIPVSLEQALAPFGEVVAIDGVTRVEPGSQVTFGLSGQVLSITPQDTTGTYRIEYQADDGETHTIWLGTAPDLAARLGWAERYHLGGVAVADMLDPGNPGGVIEAVMAYADYRTTAAPPAGQPLDVVWTVSSAAATVDQQVSPLTEPGYTWMVLATSGTYTVQATIAGFDHGSVPIIVGEPEPAITETTTTTATTAMTAEAGGTEAVTTTVAIPGEGEGGVDECLDARYVADVTIPDDTQLDNGEEFDKTWRVRNAGSCAWPEDTVLAFSSGSQMDAPGSVEVGEVEPGEEVEVTVKMTAPADAGRYTGVWQMKTAAGVFGGNLSVVIRAGEVAEAPAAVVAPISSGSFELGAHITNQSFPHADKMHYAGMTWAKEQIAYGGNASNLIAAAHANGFKIQMSALGSAGMVTQSGFEQNFANWVAGMAAAGADAIEIWNEPNIDREWQIGHISPQAYTKLLCASYNAIKAANPNTAVISAAPSPTGYFGGCSPNGCDDAPWIAGLRDAGAANCMDYLGAHHNAGATSPSARSGHPAGTHHSWYFLPQTELYYNTFGGARKLFYTEMGYASQEGVPTFSDAFGWARGINNAQQAAWLAEGVQLSINTGMVRCIIVWNIGRSRYAGYDPQDGYNIIRPDGSCPACDSLHNVLGTR